MKKLTQHQEQQAEFRKNVESLEEKTLGARKHAELEKTETIVHQNLAQYYAIPLVLAILLIVLACIVFGEY